LKHLDKPQREDRVRTNLIDTLEPRVLLAVDSEMRWMIQAAGGAITPSPGLTVTTNLPTSGGYLKTTDPTSAIFSGNANAVATASVKVNGVAASYTPASGAWTLANGANVTGLKPGINRVQVRSYDASNVELTRKTVDVWYDAVIVTPVSGTLSGNNIWTATNGPYLVTGNLTIASGAVLTIQPGTSVYFGSGVGITVNSGGRIDAEGNEFQHIRFTRNPSASANWAGFTINSSQDNKIEFADIEYASSGSRALKATSAKLLLDHVDFDHIGKQYLNLTSTSVIVSNCVFPNITSDEPIHGATELGTAGSYAIFRRNVHGTTTGYSDIIDFTGGQRPGSILQVYDSWFLGGQDDGLDLDSTDAWIENNVFEHFHQPNGRSTPESKSFAISTGNENKGTTELTVERNYFFDNDHMIVVKDGSSASIINNTIVNIHKLEGATEATTSVVNLYEVRSGQYQAVNVYMDGNIIQDISQLFELPQPFPSGHPGNVKITMARNILPAGVTYPAAGATITFGAGNITSDPKLLNTVGVLDPTTDFMLQPGSPAQGAGPIGADMGAVIPTGVSLSGEPAAYTNNKNALLTVGFVAGTGTNAAGYLAYKYRVNNGAYSAETPIGTPISLTNLADGAYTIYAVGKNDAGTYQTEADVTASKTWVVDTVAPKISSSTFNYQLAEQSLVVQFDEDVPGLTKSALTLTDADHNTTIDPSEIGFAYDSAAHVATITFPGFANGRLADGNYRLILNGAAVKDRATNSLDGNGDGTGGDDYTMDFFALAGDANHDGSVNFADLVTVAQNYGGTDKSYVQGDFDFDGVVGFSDLVMVAQKYGKTLAPPVPPAAAPLTEVRADSVLSPVKSEGSVIKGAGTPAKKPAPVAAGKPVFATRRI
jgi:hypothetical protein